MGGRLRKKTGAALPAVPCALADVPIGAAVQISLPCGSSLDFCAQCGIGDDKIGRSGWFQITFKIGEAKNGSRNLRSFGHLGPDEKGWIETPDHCHLVSPDVNVLAVEWPIRIAPPSIAEVADPVGGSAGHGPLFSDVATKADPE